MTKKKTNSVNNSSAMVIHLPVKIHSKLKLHTLLKQNDIGGKITLAKEAEKAIAQYLSSEGYV